jgi:hypothetical protein
MATAPNAFDSDALSRRWHQFSALVVRWFHRYATWLVSLSWWRFAAYSLLLIIAVSIIKDIPPFSWKYTETIVDTSGHRRPRIPPMHPPRPVPAPAEAAAPPATASFPTLPAAPAAPAQAASPAASGRATAPSIHVSQGPDKGDSSSQKIDIDLPGIVIDAGKRGTIHKGNVDITLGANGIHITTNANAADADATARAAQAAASAAADAAKQAHLSPQQVEDIREKAREAAQMTPDQLQRILEQAQLTRDQAEKVREQAQAAREQALEQAQAAREQAQEQAERTREQAQAQAERIREQAQEQAQRYREQGQQARERALAEAEKAREDARQEVERAKDQAMRDIARDTGRDMPPPPARAPSTPAAAPSAPAHDAASSNGVDMVVGGQHVHIALPPGASSEEIADAVDRARESITDSLTEAEDHRREEMEQAREDAKALADQKTAKSAGKDEDGSDGDDSDTAVADNGAGHSTVRTHTVHYGDSMMPLTMWWVLGSLLLKITYKGRIQAEAKAAVATETAEAESLRRQVLEARMAMMQAQVEPHFLFNTLASIDHLIEFDPKRASQMQRNLISLLRASMPSMRASDSGLRPLDLELAVVRPYLEILKVRMEERLTTEIDVPEGLLSAEFPPMMIQTLVENSIKHGLEPKAEGGHLSVKAEIRHGNLCVVVADTGLGFDSAAKGATHGTGVGLANIRERLALLYGNKASLTIANNPGGGTLVTITVPYTTHADEGASA